MSDKFTKDMTFAQALRTNPEVARVLAKYNLGCIGCMGAQNESLEQGCNAHGLDVNEILKDLNAINIEGAMKQVEGTARSMGITIVD